MRLAESLGLSFIRRSRADKEPQRQSPFSKWVLRSPLRFPARRFAVRVDLLNQSPESVNVESIAVAASDGKAWRITSKGDPAKALAARTRAKLDFR